MADEFDIVDIVFSAVESSGTALTLYKENSADAEKGNHVTVRSLGLNEPDSVNTSYVNVNVFVAKNRNGTEDRGTMKAEVRRIRSAIGNIRYPTGMHWKSRVEWSEPLGEVKAGFDCTNIRLRVITEK
jgi:hypothetical protein